MNNLFNTMDARKWAREFMKNRHIIIDEEIMHIWFANSIMNGYDHGVWRERERSNMKLIISVLSGFLLGLITATLIVYCSEPKVKLMNDMNIRRHHGNN